MLLAANNYILWCYGVNQQAVRADGSVEVWYRGPEPKGYANVKEHDWFLRPVPLGQNPRWGARSAQALALETKLSPDAQNPLSQAKPGSQALSVAEYVILTNWLLTPVITRNEGVAGVAKADIRQLGTNALPALLALLRQQNTNGLPAASMAMIGFEALGPAATPAVESLMECLEDSDPAVRATAARCLADIGPSATRAVPKLVAALKDSSPDVRITAVLALTRVLGPSDLVVPALVKFLEGPRPGKHWEWERVVAIAVLEKHYVEHAAPAIPVLRQLTNDSSSVIRNRAEGLLWTIEHPRPPELGPLLPLPGGYNQGIQYR